METDCSKCQKIDRRFCNSKRQCGSKKDDLFLSQNDRCRREQMILENRKAAKHMAVSLLARWGAGLEEDEIDSIRDLALCEAAKNYRAEKGTQFLTYFHFFLRGFLIQEFRKRVSQSESDMDMEHSIQLNSAAQEFMDRGGFQMPDEALYQQEIRERCEEAIEELSPIEKRVLTKVELLGCKVARVARELGYSRGYVSEVRSRACEKLREKAFWFYEAAYV